MTKAETLALFIVQNWHYCPIDENVTIEKCEGWTGGCTFLDQMKCAKCICKHSNEIFIGKDN